MRATEFIVEGLAEGFPQPGPSSGAPKQFGPDAKIQTRQMTVKDIISSVPGVPYYNNVVDDWDAKDYSWGVTKKVIEYATYLKDHPESLAKLPPAIVLNGKFEDGAHRVSAIWLLQQRMDPKNPLWKNAKLNVQFVKQGVAEEVNPDVTSKKYFIDPTENVRMGDFEFNARTFTGALGSFNAKGLQIRAYDPKNLKRSIGSADFIVKTDKKGNQWLESDDTEVDEKYQGQGIATMMYAFAKSLGNDIKDSPYKSKAGSDMWSKWGSDAKHLVGEQGVAEGSLEELANTSLKVKEPKDFVNTNDRKQVTYKVMKFKSGKDTYLINFTVKGAPAFGKKQNWNALNVAFGVREEQDDYSFGDEINTDLTAKNKNQFLIYSTVINAVRKFITEYNTEIDEIIMQGAGERQEAMYQRFFQSAGKYFPGWHHDGKHSLVRDVPRQTGKKVKEQGVAEGRENYNGVNILFQKDDDEIFVKASAGGRELGHVLFVIDGDYLMPQDLEVEERFRGQGIAQTMYDYVKSKGYKIHRSGQQTDAGAGFWDKHKGQGQNVWEQGVAEGTTVTRIDSKPITNFGSSLKAYKHTDDWSQSGVDTGDDSYWKNKNLKTNTTKGLFAGDPRRTALYATGNAHETRYVEFTQNGQPIVYFDRKDLPAMRSRKTYLTVFDASDFRQLPTGEWFSENPSKPIKQVPIGDPFKYIASQGWIVRVTDDLDKVFKQVQNMHKAGKIAQYGAEGMNENKQGVAEGIDDSANLSRLQSVQSGRTALGLVNLPVVPSNDNPNTTAKVVNTGSRIVAVYKVRGVNIPFYISTGGGGKASVPTGKWYPVFGIHSSGWLNKGTEESINKFYGSKELARGAEILNKYLGDLRSVEDKIPLMKPDGYSIINKNLKPMSWNEVDSNVNEFKKRINAILVQIGDAPHYPEVEYSKNDKKSQIVHLQNLAKFYPNITMKDFVNQGKEKIINDAMLEVNQLKNYYGQHKQANFVQLLSNLENDVNSFKRGSLANTNNQNSVPNLGLLLKGTLGKINFATP